MNLINDISNAINKVEWSFESRDPLWAWLIVAMYSIAAFLCLRALIASQRSLFPLSIKKKSRVFWIVLFGIMLFLACNKQLDIQTYITAVGREVAHAQGWYDQRRSVQKEVIVVLGLVAFLVLSYLVFIVYHLPTGNKISMIGALFTFTFIGMRASSFHHLDHYVAQTIYGVKLHILIEIVGGVIVCFGALLSVRSRTKWELYYDKHMPDEQDHGLINQEYDLDSEADSDYIDNGGKKKTGNTTRIDISHSASMLHPEYDNTVSESNRMAISKSGIEVGDRQERVNPSVAELVSGSGNTGDINDDIDLFKMVSDPDYKSGHSPKVDNSSPRVSRERLSEVNRRRRERMKIAENSAVSSISSKRSPGRDDNWITKEDETGWI